MMKISSTCLLALCLLAVNPSGADQVRTVISNEAAIMSRLQMIKLAKSEILAQYFEVGRDPMALKALSLLKEAADRGVRVKLIVDDMHNELKTRDLAALMGVINTPKNLSNFEIRVFNPLTNLKLLDQTYRDHSKRLIIDGEAMIIGGRNVAQGYFGLGITRSKDLRDMDMMVRGQSVQSARQDFLELWNKNPMIKEPALYDHSYDVVQGPFCTTQGDLTDCTKREISILDIKNSEREFQQFLQKANEMAADRIVDSLADLFNNSDEVDVQFVSNNPTQKMKDIEDKLEVQLFRYLNVHARQSITIVTPYLFPTPKAMEMLRSFIQRGVKVRIVTNSLASIDVTVVYAGYSRLKKQFADMGAEVYEYRGPEILHAKLLVMDVGTPNATTMIGSFNFDRRSALINREIGIVITGADRENVALKTNSMIERIITDSYLSIGGGRFHNEDKLEALVENLGWKEADRKRDELQRSQGIVDLFPDHI